MYYDYDVISRGVGLLSSILVYNLAQDNFKSCLVDKWKSIGVPLFLWKFIFLKFFLKFLF